ncbi:type II secretion system F family protein [Actinoallomurus sp. NPDC050550]|uniref:type II secretion system F family protein n=1 Tax=Actinoallomurus sp. NPDC050550 TaxID=3154937 RepID=UPI0033C17DAC
MEILLMAAAAALCFVLGVWGFALMRSGERVAQDILTPPEKRKARSDGTILNQLADVLGRPLTRPMLEFLGPRRRQIRRRIDAAGRPGDMTVESYARQTAGLIILFVLPGILFVLQGQTFFGILLMFGVGQNELLLAVRTRQRQDEIERMLPDFLDVLAVTVTAGLGFRHALSRVAESMPGALAEEFTISLQQMELGTPRREAFEDLRRRNRAEMLGQFVTAILQAEELGAPLATALMELSTDMRRESAQWAKRKAQRITPRITAVSAALTLPAIMAIVVGGMFYSSGADLGGLLR